MVGIPRSKPRRRPLVGPVDRAVTGPSPNADYEDTYVWVVENGCYSDRYLSGVYESIEAVVAAYPAKSRGDKASDSASYLYRPGGWQQDEHDPDRWDNGLDWDDFLRATRHKVRRLPHNGSSGTP